MASEPKKIIRSHDRQKRNKKRDPKGERFHLQGARWRFPREIGLGEVEVRIGRLRALWADQERFCQSAVFLNLHAATQHQDLSLADAVAFVRGEIGTLDSQELCPDSIGPGESPGTVSNQDWLQSTLESLGRDRVPQGVSPTQLANWLGENIHKVRTRPASSPSWLQRTILHRGIVRIPLETNWSPLTLWIAENIKFGVQPVRLPDWQALIDSVCRDGKIEYRFRCLGPILERPPEARPNRVEQLDSREALELWQSLMEAFPSVPWAMYDHQIAQVVRIHEERARQDLQVICEVKPDHNGMEKLPIELPGVRGSFHGALRSYFKKRQADFTTRGTFDGSGHHMLGLVDNLVKRLPDVPLAKLGFAECQEFYDFWRNRPLNTRTKEPLSAKHCSSHIGELDRFFKWLHKTTEFGWRRPQDFDLIDKRVKRLDSDRRSIQDIELKTFQIDHLKLLYQHALPPERLKLLWCLNCSHGAAEIGRVEWGDIYLEQQHPWIKDGLKFNGSPSDSWCGLLRPKTDVIGWWWLWPETVQLVKWWREKVRQDFSRDPLPSERMLVTNTGEPLYRDSSRNAQTSFANQWTRLIDRVLKIEGKNAVPRLPFGTLRDQMSNWLGSDENQAVLASTALAHGIPHKGDKLLFKHYSNRPWAHLFQKQREYRQVLQPMFEGVPDHLQGA